MEAAGGAGSGTDGGGPDAASRARARPGGGGAAGEVPGSALPGRMADAAARLHRLTGLPLRVVVASEDGELVVHDSLEDGAPPAGLTERTLGGRRGGRGRVAWPAGRDRDEAGEAVARLLDGHLRLEEENRLFVQELSERYEQISLLTSISETLGSVIQLDRAAEEILADVVDVTGAARASLWLHEPGADALSLLATRGMEDPVVRRVDPGDEDSVVAGVFRSQQPLLVEPDGQGLAQELRGAWEGFGGAPLLIVPVTCSGPEGEGRRVGVLGLVGRRDGSRFTAGDRKLMTAIASQVGAVVENGRLVRESLRRERLAAELGLAHDLQLTLLPDPSDLADLTGVAARCEPAESVGGDFYHLIRLSGGRLGVMLGDVSSHGISASLIMAQAMSAAGIVAREEERPGAVLGRMDRVLRRELASAEMYVTLFYAVVEPGGSFLRYASAGHPHAFLVAGGEARRLGALDLPLGLQPGADHRERRVEVPEGGGLLFLFTDGLFEPASGAWRASEGRIVSAAVEAADEGPEAVVEATFEGSDRQVQGDWDDRTAVAVELRPDRAGGGEGR